MNQRERQHPENQPTAGPAGTGGDPNQLNQTRQEGQDLLAAADAAIDKVLSGDSAAFNQAVRQQGGE